jgi:hypothetical protein
MDLQFRKWVCFQVVPKNATGDCGVTAVTFDRVLSLFLNVPPSPAAVFGLPGSGAAG